MRKAVLILGRTEANFSAIAVFLDITFLISTHFRVHNLNAKCARRSLTDGRILRLIDKKQGLFEFNLKLFSLRFSGMDGK
jgi:hypothetical protein